MRVKDLSLFITKREEVRIRKEANAQKPWTGDEILQQYRFCNVRREDDAVTKWIAENWRAPNSEDPYLFFAMTAARLFNEPRTLQLIGYPVPWDPAEVLKVLKNIQQAGDKVFNAAYIVSTNGISMDKVEYVVQQVLGPIWMARDKLVYEKGESLASYHKRLTKLRGLGSFMAAQVIADLKYTDKFFEAPDWFTFAASGPGSRRGLNRVMARVTKDSWREHVWHDTLLALLNAVNKRLRWGVPLHAQDLQNCLCEFDKYERARMGEGRPKQKYSGKE